MLPAAWAWQDSHTPDMAAWSEIAATSSSVNIIRAESPGWSASLPDNSNLMLSTPPAAAAAT